MGAGGEGEWDLHGHLRESSCFYGNSFHGDGKPTGRGGGGEAGHLYRLSPCAPGAGVSAGPARGLP